MMIRVVSVVLLLALGACNTPSGSNSSDPTPPAAHPSETDDDAIVVCDLAQADRAIQACLPGWSTERKSTLKTTWAGWADERGQFAAIALERSTFQKRYALSPNTVKCLTLNFCKNEDMSP